MIGNVEDEVELFEDFAAEDAQVMLRSPLVSFGNYQPTKSLKQEREAFLIPLEQGATWVELNRAR